MWAYNDGMGTVTFNHDLVSVSTWHTYVEFSSVGRLTMADAKFPMRAAPPLATPYHA
jgi:hypothetical protein